MHRISEHLHLGMVDPGDSSLGIVFMLAHRRFFKQLFKDLPSSSSDRLVLIKSGFDGHLESLMRDRLKEIADEFRQNGLFQSF